MKKTSVLIDNLYFGEGPRWKNGKLWVSDMMGGNVVAIDVSSATVKNSYQVEGRPSGLGWLPDGRLLVVSMQNRKVLRLESNGLFEEHADLSGAAAFDANDMVVDSKGYAYVGNFGFDVRSYFDKYGRETLLDPNANVPTAKLACVEPDGKVRVVADELVFPNGSVLADRGSTLVVAETYARRLTAFDVDSDGNLSNRRIWAQFDSTTPDGICLDAEGAIWVADSGDSMALRVAEGGEILSRVETSQRCFAVALGGEDGCSLFCCTAPNSEGTEPLGKIEQIQVEVPSA